MPTSTTSACMTLTSWLSTSSWGKRLDRGHYSGSRRPTGLPPSHCFLRWWDGRRPRRCWAVPPSHLFHVSRPCMRSGHQCACSRARVFLNILSIHEKREIKVGWWGKAPCCGSFRRPTFFCRGGTHGTPEKQKTAGIDIHRHSPAVHRASPTHSPDGIKPVLLPPESTCKKGPSSMGATAKRGRPPTT